MKYFVLFLISVVVLWKYGEISTKKEVLRMTEKFINEYQIYKPYFKVKDSNKNKLFKYDKVIIINLSPEAQIKFSSYKIMRKEFKQKGSILLYMLENVEEKDSEIYSKLNETLKDIRGYILYCGEKL